jgi:protein-L-isoaspartate(D-aspartate) O-methyltransferase
MVIPVGDSRGCQDLMLVERGVDGRIRERQLFSVAFVPLTGGQGAGA